jgi:hypothetical protein
LLLQSWRKNRSVIIWNTAPVLPVFNIVDNEFNNA